MAGFNVAAPGDSVPDLEPLIVLDGNASIAVFASDMSLVVLDISIDGIDDDKSLNLLDGDTSIDLLDIGTGEFSNCPSGGLPDPLDNGPDNGGSDKRDGWSGSRATSMLSLMATLPPSKGRTSARISSTL